MWECSTRLGSASPGSQHSAGPALLSNPQLTENSTELQGTNVAPMGQKQPQGLGVAERIWGPLAICTALEPAWASCCKVSLTQTTKALLEVTPTLTEPQPSFFHSKLPSLRGNADSNQEYAKVPKHRAYTFYFFFKNQAPFSSLIFGL